MSNLVLLTGHVGQDPSVRVFENNTKKAECSLATNKTWKNKDGEKQQRTEWHRLVIWGPLVDVFEMWVTKGNLIQVQGEIRYREYENKEGETRKVTEIFVERMDMLGGKADQGDTAEPGATQSNKPVQQATHEAAVDTSPEMQPQDDLPF